MLIANKMKAHDDRVLHSHVLPECCISRNNLAITIPGMLVSGVPQRVSPLFESRLFAYWIEVGTVPYPAQGEQGCSNEA
jgi:hypothetical protein